MKTRAAFLRCFVRRFRDFSRAGSVFWGPHGGRTATTGLFAGGRTRDAYWPARSSQFVSTCARAVPVAVRSRSAEVCAAIRSRCRLAVRQVEWCFPCLARSELIGPLGRPIEGCALGVGAEVFGRRRGRLGWGPQEGRRAGAASSTHLQLPWEAAFQALSCIQGRTFPCSLRGLRIVHHLR